MKKYAGVLLILLLFPLAMTSEGKTDQKETCLSCHQRKTPAIALLWSSSAHAEAQIGCQECHSEDYKDISTHTDYRERRVVEAFVCARCHDKRAKEHFAGKHGIGFRAGRACTRGEKKNPEILKGCKDCHEEGTKLPRQDTECARFLAQSPEMRRQGCLGCHKVENRCDSCHTSHDTSLHIVRDPAICGTCHMGPDHPQYEMWQSSKHGILFYQKGREYSPDCLTCHMPEGNHNVSLGITMGLAGQPYPDDVKTKERSTMLKICTACHSTSIAKRNLDDADAIQLQAKKLVDEAAAIIRDLDSNNLLMPSPTDRPAHPLAGHTLEIGPQMLYENLSRVEALFFRMKKFYYVITYKGAFHQNPDYAHWYGNAPLKLALSEIRSEAELLKEIKLLMERIDNFTSIYKDDPDTGVSSEKGGLKMDLMRLKELYLQGDISEDDYISRKSELLDKHGL